uniref:Uncharacterized protein n=1 Tax=Meloidogyne javanica TaxID=6303 RepID=A0A915MCU6_MELJA
DIVAKALEVDSAAKLAEKDRKARSGEKRNSTKESQQQQKSLYSIPTTSTTSILDNVGNDDPQGESTNAEIVDRLVERLESASNLDDRRDALRALRSLAR